MAYQPLWVNTKAILIEEQWCYYLIHSWRDNRVHNVSKDINLNMNIAARMEFKLIHYDVAVQYINHSTMGTLHKRLWRRPAEIAAEWKHWQK